MHWTRSSAFERLGDGNEDMRLYFAARAASGPDQQRRLQAVVGGDGPLGISRRTYAWPANTPNVQVAPDNPYSAFHRARRRILSALAH